MPGSIPGIASRTLFDPESGWHMAAGRPDLVQARLQSAALFGETFYGQLARQSLGIAAPPAPAMRRPPEGAPSPASVEPGDHSAARLLAQLLAYLLT